MSQWKVQTFYPYKTKTQGLKGNLLLYKWAFININTTHIGTKKWLYFSREPQGVSPSLLFLPGPQRAAPHLPSWCLPFSLPAVFLTGSDRIPIYGMASLQIVIQSTASGEEYLPVAHTCYNLLDLPKYSSKEVLCARLTQALDNYEGFSLAWGSPACPWFPFLPPRPQWGPYRKSWGVSSVLFFFLLYKWVGTFESWIWWMHFWGGKQCPFWKIRG